MPTTCFYQEPHVILKDTETGLCIQCETAADAQDVHASEMLHYNYRTLTPSDKIAFKEEQI